MIQTTTFYSREIKALLARYNIRHAILLPLNVFLSALLLFIIFAADNALRSTLIFGGVILATNAVLLVASTLFVQNSIRHLFRNSTVFSGGSGTCYTYEFSEECFTVTVSEFNNDVSATKFSYANIRRMDVHPDYIMLHTVKLFCCRHYVLEFNLDNLQKSEEVCTVLASKVSPSCIKHKHKM